MRELVIVITDLYLPAALPAGAVDESSVPGLGRLARFGRRLMLEHGWREWLARWIGRDDLARATPASVVAAGTQADGDPGEVAWLATPVHLAAGLTTLHFDVRGILRPAREEIEQLAADFHRSFHDSGVRLVPLDSGELLLMLQPAIPPTMTTEPARMAAGRVSDALPEGGGAAKLRLLGAEIEMWLHEHPLNRARAGKNDVVISTLWIWGGGEGAAVTRNLPGALPRAFGSDSYVRALWQLAGHDTHPLPEQLDRTFGYAPGAVLAIEAGRMLRGNSAGGLSEGLAELDRRFVAPAVDALRRGELDRVSVLVNDRHLALTSGAHRRFWRRPRPFLESLR